MRLNKFAVILLAFVFATNTFAAQIKTKFIEDSAITAAKLATDSVVSAKIQADAVGAGKIRLENDTALRARNQAGNADVNLFKLNSSDIMEFSFFPITPSAAPDADYEVANKKYVDDEIAAIPGNMTPYRVTITLAGGDITAQYVDLAQDCNLSTVSVDVFGVMALMGTDLIASDEGAATRLTFGTPFATGGVSELVATDKLQVYCSY